MNILPWRKWFLLVSGVYVLFTCQPVFANPCEWLFGGLSPERAALIENYPWLSPYVMDFGAVTESVPRVGEFRRASNSEDYLSRGEGVFEVLIEAIESLHSVPNPYRYPDPHPSGYEDLLAEKILTEGYRLGPYLKDGAPIHVGIMPDGRLFCLGGHHRLYAMKKLNQKYIPALVFDWNQLGPDVHSLFRPFLLDQYNNL